MSTSASVRGALGWRKRSADEMSEPASSASSSGHHRNKRPRPLTVFANLPHGDTPSQSHEIRDAEEDTADEPRPRVPQRIDGNNGNVPLTEAMDEHVSIALTNEMQRMFEPSLTSHQGCFICEFTEAYSNEVRGGNAADTAGVLCFKMMRDFHRDNPHMSQVTKANHLTNIYKIYAYNPICEANGGTAPDWLPKPDVTIMLYHLRYHSGDPMADVQRIRDFLIKSLLLVESKLVVDNIIDLDTMKMGVKLSQDLFKLHLQVPKLTMTGTSINGMSLDRDQVLAFTGNKPIESLTSTTRNMLGGVSSINNDAVINRVTMNRPVMGELSDNVDEAEISVALDEMVQEESMNIDI